MYLSTPSAVEQTMVRIEHLSKRFGRFTAVDDINLQVYRGEIFGFLGANGAGKTTTIRMLCGLLQPTSGNAWIDGLDIAGKRQQIKSRIGYMSQKFSLYDDLPVRENIEFFAGVYGLIPGEAIDASARLDLTDYLHRITRDLPLGQKQRLALYCAMMHGPAVLFLDEPTAGVDPVSRRQFWQIIHQVAARGTTVFVTTHFMDEAEYCQRLSIMHQGKICALGSPTQLKQRYGEKSIQDLFIRLVDEQTHGAENSTGGSE